MAMTLMAARFYTFFDALSALQKLVELVRKTSGLALPHSADLGGDLSKQINRLGNEGGLFCHLLIRIAQDVEDIRCFNGCRVAGAD